MAEKDNKPKTTEKSKAKPAAKSNKQASVKPKTTANIEKQREEKSGGGSFKGGVAAVFRNKKLTAIIMSAVAFVLILAIVIGIVVGTKSCNKDDGIINDNPIVPGITPVDPPDGGSAATSGVVVPNDKPLSKDMQILSPVGSADIPQEVFKNEYPNTSEVGYHAELTGEQYERVKPVAGTLNEGAAFDSEATGSVFADGAARYPTYGSTLRHVIGEGDEQVAARTAIINESSYLCAWGTRGANNGGAQTADKYTRIDANGYLYQYKDNEWIHSLKWGETQYTSANYRRLYKHSAAEGMYLEGYTRGGVTYAVSDDAVGVVKEVTMRSRRYSSYGVTGLYAPAGEVIKVEISGKDMRATGGIAVHIGQALYNGQANNIWVAKNQMQRIPHVLNTLVLNTSTTEYDEENDIYTGYIGSFVGGPIYIRNAGTTFTVKISGGLEYLHFILGYTTEDEFNRIKSASTVPYFDLEVWNFGVLHSGPRYYAETFSYDDLYKAAVLWEKVSSVTTTGSSQGIVFIYDPFVAAGAAVAFPGRSSVNCPAGWMAGSLNYNGIVSSGSWGNFHEYHHNFQGYGVGNGGEVTNNAMTLVSYALFTKISSKRSIAAYGAQGLGGWNNYTSATWALSEVLKIPKGQTPSNGNQGLALYATLLHNFGADAFIQAKKQGGGQSYAAYMNAWQNVTHNNMYYYFKDLLKGTGISDNADSSYPMFVPVSCVYQTGRSYMYDGEKKYFKTMQPYMISNEPFTVDLSQYTVNDAGQYQKGSIVIPDGFTYKVKKVTKPARGTLEITDGSSLVYTPAANAKTGDTSGQILVTLEITKNDGAFKVDDVDLVLEFEVSQEMNKMTLQRTTYTYSANNAYTDAQTAFEANFAGYEGQPYKHDHSNPTQNANTDIWVYPDNEANRKAYPDAPDYFFSTDNKIDVIDGKLFFENDGKYRVYLRGRLNCALYFSLDGKDYKLGATIKDTAAPSKSWLFRPNDANTYFDVEFNEGDVIVTVNAGADNPREYILKIAPNKKNEITNWLYIKEIMIVQSSPAVSYIGVGMRQWVEPQFTQEIKYFRDEDCTVPVTTAQYNAMTEEEREALFSKTYYLNNAGQEVSEEDVMSAQMTPPVVTEKSQPYVNAYRYDYDFPDNSEFTSEYFYVRSQTYSYSEESKIAGHKLLDYTNFTPYAANGVTYSLENLFEGNANGMWHSGYRQVNPNNPFTMTVDANSSVLANKMVITGRHGATPRTFELYVGDSLDNLQKVTFTDIQLSGTTGITVEFEAQRFRYYKLVITQTTDGKGGTAGNYLAMLGLTFSYGVSGGEIITPDSDMVVFDGTWKTAQEYSTFGHVYVGKNNSLLNFVFNGTGLKIISSKKFGADYTVYIDGKEAESTPVFEDNGLWFVSFCKEGLADGKHTVKIVCKGETSIDSLVII